MGLRQNKNISLLLIILVRMICVILHSSLLRPDSVMCAPVASRMNYLSHKVEQKLCGFLEKAVLVLCLVFAVESFPEFGFFPTHQKKKSMKYGWAH